MRWFRRTLLFLHLTSSPSRAHPKGPLRCTVIYSLHARRGSSALRIERLLTADPIGMIPHFSLSPILLPLFEFNNDKSTTDGIAYQSVSSVGCTSYTTPRMLSEGAEPLPNMPRNFGSGSNVKSATSPYCSYVTLNAPKYLQWADSTPSSFPHPTQPAPQKNDTASTRRYAQHPHFKSITLQW